MQELSELDPKPKDLTSIGWKYFKKKILEGRTRVCCIKLGKFVVGSEDYSFLVIAGFLRKLLR